MILYTYIRCDFAQLRYSHLVVQATYVAPFLASQGKLLLHCIDYEFIIIIIVMQNILIRFAKNSSIVVVDDVPKKGKTKPKGIYLKEIGIIIFFL